MFKKAYSILFLILISLSFQSVAKPFNPEDRYENFNRAMFEFNMGFHDYIGEPVSNAYKKGVPKPARDGVSNFFINLRMPLNMTNNFLQGNVEKGLNDFMRFALNTVFGLGGLLDIATPAGLTYEKTDFGHTLYKWGVWHESSFVMMPFLGGYTVRDLFGKGVEYTQDPTFSYIIQTTRDGHIAFSIADGFDNYVKVTDLVDLLKTMPDPYVFYRESYFQQRGRQLNDGITQIQPLDDFDFD
ncbi:VacJ family lipoprotein [Thiomicrospira sp. R3]|uniref:MlaA family lipoprotein n=1 Tax=Thiomicrospira sp. R3 TaxID=3035472 RepID=UPI00259BACF0|nr:VacJ family lipoprotein [Thiomicrospira sp. R3]WFE69578.1 VacJ family lipoprotein [Thiomicrospira sp. R3]